MPINRVWSEKLSVSASKPTRSNDIPKQSAAPRAPFMSDEFKRLPRRPAQPMESLVSPRPFGSEGKKDPVGFDSSRRLRKIPLLHARGTSDNLGNRENKHLEFKSLRLLDGKRGDFDAIARECVGFANSNGGRIAIGIEDKTGRPPRGQRLAEEMRDLVVRKVKERTVNVDIEVNEEHSIDHDADYLLVRVLRSQAIASTSDGRFYKRYADSSIPLQGDHIGVLITDRAARPWEASVASGVRWVDADKVRVRGLADRLRDSERVSSHVKDKPIEEMLEHFRLLHDGNLTHLGVLLVGDNFSRFALGTSPIVQMIRHDIREQRVEKFMWGSDCNPLETLENSLEALKGMCRDVFQVPYETKRISVEAYDTTLLRELLVNAIVHRPYTQQGDIYVGLFPNRLEIVNPGSLPPGITPQNILHRSARRNEGLAHIFDSLELMEREGTGIDLIYEKLITTGRIPPRIEAGDDYVKVTVWPQIARPEVVRIMARAEKNLLLTPRERITLALVGGQGSVTSTQLAETLLLPSLADLEPWTRNLAEAGVLVMEEEMGEKVYTYNSEVFRDKYQLRSVGSSPPAPQSLVRQVLGVFEESEELSASEIHTRMASPMTTAQMRGLLRQLVAQEELEPIGNTRGRRYRRVSARRRA